MLRSNYTLFNLNLVLLLFICSMASLEAKVYEGRSISFTVPDQAVVKFDKASEREDYVIVYEDEKDQLLAVQLTMGKIDQSKGAVSNETLIQISNQGVVNSAKVGNYRLDEENCTMAEIKTGIFTGVRLNYPIVLRNGDDRVLRYFILDDGKTKWMAFYDTAREDDVFSYNILESIKNKD